LEGYRLNQIEKSSATVSKILLCAAELFAENGFDATTLQEITEKAQLSKGAVYHHFTSKQQIMDCLIQKQIDEINGNFIDLVNQTDLCAKEKLNKLANQFCDSHMQHLLIQAKWVENNPGALLITTKNTLTHISNSVSEIIQQGTKNGEFDCSYPDEVASILCLMLDIWIDPSIIALSEKTICDRIDFVKDFLNKYGLNLDDSW
jgi:Transcriptional regulator